MGVTGVQTCALPICNATAGFLPGTFSSAGRVVTPSGAAAGSGTGRRNNVFGVAPIDGAGDSPAPFDRKGDAAKRLPSETPLPWDTIVGSESNWAPVADMAAAAWPDAIANASQAASASSISLFIVTSSQDPK